MLSAKGSAVSMCLFFTGYVTRFVFALHSYKNHCKDDNHDNHAVQPTERCCHIERLCTSDSCEFCPCQLCSSAHEQSTENCSDSCDGKNKRSVQHVYDDDGDLIVKRKFHQQFEIIYIG